MSEEFKRELEKLIEEIRSRVEVLAEEVEELYESGEYYRAFRKWSEGMASVLRSVRGSLSKLSDLAREYKLSDEEIKESLDYFRDSLEEVVSRVDSINKKLRERGKRFFEVYVGVGPHNILKEVFRGVETSIEGVMRGVEKAIESIEETITKTTQVVSVRMRDRDLEVIDELVDAGIFKSRSEAITYFTKKGIEANKEWIEKAIEQAKKIKELQEQVRKELREHKETGEEDENKT